MSLSTPEGVRSIPDGLAQAASEAAQPGGTIPLDRALPFPDPVLGESNQEYCQRIIRSLWRIRNENLKARCALRICTATYREAWPRV